MPVTTLHKLIGLSVAMLGQAPGTDLLNQWTRLYTQSREDGMNAMAALQKVAQHILDSDAFAEVHPAYLIIEDSDFAQRFLNQLLGETASAEVVTLVVGLLDGGTSRAEVAVRAVEYLLEVNRQGSDHTDHGTFGTYAMRFGNQVEVARYYTVDKKWMTPDGSVLNGVDDTAASVTVATTRIDGMKQPGKNFALTTNVDQFTGTSGDDMFVATESTLNGADRLNGKEGMDTLELSSGSGANADISIPVGATVKGIETLSVSSDGDFSGDVSQWTGLETVTLEVVKDVDLDLDADAGVKVTSKSLGDDEDASTVTIENAGMVDLDGVSKKATVKITGEGTESVMVEGGMKVHVGTKTSPSMTVNSVTIDGVARATSKSVEVYAKALANIALHNTDAIVLFSNKDMTALTAMVNKFGTSTRMGELQLAGTTDLTLEVVDDSNFAVASSQINKIEVSGAGDLTLDVNKSGTTASTTLESLMLSGTGKFTMADASGLSKLKTIDASDATGDVHIMNLAKGVTSYTGSNGKDTISIKEFNSQGLKGNLGDGDDILTVVNQSAGNSKIDGGAGMDTLVLKQDKGANLKGAGDSYRNFETITLDAGGGSGKYNLKGLAIDELLISKATSSGGVTFDNVKPGTDLVIKTAKDEASHTSTVTYNLEEADRFSTRADSHLDLIIESTGHSSFTTQRYGPDSLYTYEEDGERKEHKNFRKGTEYATKPVINLTLDAAIESLTVNYTAIKGAAEEKARQAVSFDSFTAAGLEELKVTGNALVILKEVTLSNLTYVDARGSGGIQIERLKVADNQGVEFHGSDNYDAIIITTNGAAKDKLMGYGGDDLLVGGLDQDIIVGGAGADEMIGGQISGTWPDFSVPGPDSDPDTFVYNMASDSQIDLSTERGYDTIYRFVGAVDPKDARNNALTGPDKIDLSKIFEEGFKGSVLTYSDGDNTKEELKNGKMRALTGNEKGDVYEDSLVNFLNSGLSDNSGLNFQSKFLFNTPASGSQYAQQHSIAVVRTKETLWKNKIKYFDNIFGLKTHTAISKIGAIDTSIRQEVTWILIDADGDGAFSASGDMVIALIELAGDIGAANFIV